MAGNPTLPPRSIAILDRRPEYARLLAALAGEDHPTALIRVFDNVDAAEVWLEDAATPIVVLADVAAAHGEVIDRAQQWRQYRRGLVLIAMFDAHEDDEVTRARVAIADARFARPAGRADWAQSFGAFLRAIPAAARRASNDRSA